MHYATKAHLCLCYMPKNFKKEKPHITFLNGHWQTVASGVFNVKMLCMLTLPIKHVPMRNYNHVIEISIHYITYGCWEFCATSMCFGCIIFNQFQDLAKPSLIW